MTNSQAPGAKRRAREAEQAHIDRVHERVEQLRAAADRERRLAEGGRGGSTFQAVYERDVTAYHHARRVSRLTFGDQEPLVFGRIDTSEGEAFHIGRVSVTDPDRNLLLVDWRAPVASAFYRATAAQPLDVARRRTLSCDGPRLIDLDDEILDVDAADKLGLEAVTGQGALLASLARTRTGRMRDIVATIQAEQDRIIRLPASGTVIVTGGPGTGKTVVALHRVAYLLYSDRDRFEHRGVLVVGPSAAFSRYIANVLPSLGEERAVVRSLDEFAHGRIPIDGWDDPRVASVKGRVEMARLCHRLVLAALPDVPRVAIRFEGTGASVAPEELDAVRRRLWQRVKDGEGPGYEGLRDQAYEAMLSLLWRNWLNARRAQRLSVPDERIGSGFDSTVRDQPMVLAARNWFWPQLDAADLLGRLVSGTIGVRPLATGLLGEPHIALLESVWRPDRPRRFTVDDVALLDELQQLLRGDPDDDDDDDQAKDDGGIRLSTDRSDPAAARIDPAGDDYSDFAHVVVDEAQDLSPMQWRMVARRAPYASWTVLGDLAQRSRIAEPSSWESIVALIGRRSSHVEILRVNYRTPAEIMAYARTVLEESGVSLADPPETVRSTEQHPILVRADEPPAVAVRRAVAAAARADGTTAVIVPTDRIDGATRALHEALAPISGELRDDVQERVRVIDARSAKGLEFDRVVIAEPERIAGENEVGVHQLYVAATRATTSLELVAAPGARVPGAELLSPGPADA